MTLAIAQRVRDASRHDAESEGVVVSYDRAHNRVVVAWETGAVSEHFSGELEPLHSTEKLTA